MATARGRQGSTCQTDEHPVTGPAVASPPYRKGCYRSFCNTSRTAPATETWSFCYATLMQQTRPGGRLDERSWAYRRTTVNAFSEEFRHQLGSSMGNASFRFTKPSSVWLTCSRTNPRKMPGESAGDQKCGLYDHENRQLDPVQRICGIRASAIRDISRSGQGMA